MRTDEGVCPYFVTLSSLLSYSVFLTLLLCLPFLLCCPSLARTAGTKTRKRPSQCEKGVPLYQRRRLLVMRKRLLILNVTPQRRDRRPRLSAQHPYYSLIYSSFSGQTRASVPTILLCLPYFVTLSSLLIMLSLVDKSRWIIFELT